MAMSSAAPSTLAAVPVHFLSGRADVRTIVSHRLVGSGVGYVFSPDEIVQLEALSADVDTSGAGGPSPVEAILSDQTDAIVARVRTGSALDPGLTGQVTFAPGLPDSSTFPAPPFVDQIQTALWEGELPEQATITVQAIDPGAVVTELRLLVWTLGEPTGRVPFAGYTRSAVVT